MGELETENSEIMPSIQFFSIPGVYATVQEEFRLISPLQSVSEGQDTAAAEEIENNCDERYMTRDTYGNK